MLANLTELKEMYDNGFMGKNALADAFADAPAKLASGEVAMVVAPLAYCGDRCQRRAGHRSRQHRRVPDAAGRQSRC